MLINWHDMKRNTTYLNSPNTWHLPQKSTQTMELLKILCFRLVLLIDTETENKYLNKMVQQPI